MGPCAALDRLQSDVWGRMPHQVGVAPDPEVAAVKTATLCSAAPTHSPRARPNPHHSSHLRCDHMLVPSTTTPATHSATTVLPADVCALTITDSLRSCHLEVWQQA